MILVLKPKKALFTLMVTVAGLTVAHLVGRGFYHSDYRNVFGLVSLFDFDKEANIPSLYSAIIILCCAVLLFTIGITKQKQGQRDFLYWRGLALIFLFLSIDESVSIHERFAAPMKEAFNLSSIGYLSWTIPYALFAIVVGTISLRFLWRLPSATRVLMIVAGVLYLGGAVGVESIGGMYVVKNGPHRDVFYDTIATCEELLEMSGMLVFLYALMSYIDSQFGNLSLRITSRSDAEKITKTS